MELDELKARWNDLDRRLEENQLVNLSRMKVLIGMKTKSAFERIYRLNCFNFLVEILAICILAPFILMTTPIRVTSFVIIEAALVVGLIPQIQKLSLLSKFDLDGKKCNELCGLVLQYKLACYRERFWVIVTVSVAMVAFYISELVFNRQVDYVFGIRILMPIGFTLLTFALAYVIAQWQRRRHAQQMKEIENGLKELEEFEK